MPYYVEAEMKEIRGALEEQLLTWPLVVQKKMFGCPGYRAKETLFAILATNALVLTQLAPADRERAASTLGATPFQADGRKGVIPSWTRFALAGPADLDPVLPFVQLSYEAALAKA